MINTLKDTITTVKAKVLGYKYITDFDYNTLFNMKLDYVFNKKQDEYSDIMSKELINDLLWHLTFCCNVKKDDPSIFILLEGNGYKLLIDNYSFKHLSQSLDTAFNVWSNKEGDNIVIIYNSIINNLISIKHNDVVCISDSIIDVKHIKSNTNNELLSISKCYINVENDLLYRKDGVLYNENKRFTLENSIIIANNIVFSYNYGDKHRAEGYNIKCRGSKVIMYLDNDNYKIGSKAIHNTNSILHVYLRKPIRYDELYNMIVSTTFHSLNNITIYYGTSTAGWLVIKPNKEIDFILTAPKLLNNINTILKENKIAIPDTMSIYSTKDMLELMYKLMKISDDKEIILKASDIKIALTSFLKNGIEKLGYVFNE